jgi:hypothetical protein
MLEAITCPGGILFSTPAHAECKDADLSIRTVKITRRGDRHHGDVNIHIYYDMHTNPSMLTISGPSALTKWQAALLGKAILARILEFHNRRINGEDRRSPPQSVFFYASELPLLISSTIDIPQ